MLLQFKVRNFRCFADEQVLSLVASGDKALARNTVAIAGARGVRAIKSALLYGANGSGKSSLVDAMATLRLLVLQSASFKSDQKLPAAPFRLDAQLRHAPSWSEVTFVSFGVRHEYGCSYTEERIHEEWLFVYPQGRRQVWFERSANGRYRFGPGLKGDRNHLRRFTGEKELFLSKAAFLHHPQLEEVHSWFVHKLIPFTGLRAGFQADLTNFRMEDPRSRALFAEMLRSADTGVEDVRLAEVPTHRALGWPNVPLPEGMPPTMKAPQFLHVDGQGDAVPFELAEESHGTQTLYVFLGTITDALQKGNTILFDEQLYSIHPMLLRQIVDMFNRSAQGQVILTTHDTNLLDLNLLRRDQIYFAEKDKSGRGRVYALADFSPRKDEAIGKGYLAGRYGAVPFVGGFPLP